MKVHKLLVEFEFIVDLDMALFKLIKDNYNNPDFVNQSIINQANEKKIIEMMLNRDHINPLELFIYGESTNLYNDFISNHLDELLKYAKAYDTFGLFITYLKYTNSNITVLCDNKQQENYIKSLNNKLNTIISTRENIVLMNYDAIYIKYYPYAVKYNDTLKGKTIYIANAKYNMEPDKDFPIVGISSLVGDVNNVRLIDLYKDIKFINKSERNE